MVDIVTVDKKLKKKIERKINKLLKNMTDDDSENKIILDKKLVPFLKNNNVSYHAFIDVLLSNKDYIKKETTVEKIIQYIYDRSFVSVMRKNEKGNLPIQTAIETGYSTDFICRHIKKCFDGIELSRISGEKAGNIDGDTILHIVMKNCEENSYDVFKIFWTIKNLRGFDNERLAYETDGLPYNEMELIKNKNNKTFIDLINEKLDIYDVHLTHLSTEYGLLKNLYNTRAYFYNLHFDKFLEKLDDNVYSYSNYRVVKENMRFYDDLKDSYKELGLESEEGLFNLCTNKLYDENFAYKKICSLKHLGYIDPNYIDNNGDDFISLALKSGYSIDFIKKLFSFAFPLINYNSYINLLRICLTKRHDIDSYLFYKFLTSDGFNLLSGTEPIFSDEINTINNCEYMFGVSQHWVFERDYTASFIKKLTHYLVDDYGLFFRVKNIETCLDMYASINVFEADIKNKLSGNINDIDLAKMVANIIYENRVNSIKENNYDDVTINEVINAIDLLTSKIDDNDFYNILAFKSKNEDNNILVFKSKNQDKVLEKNI